MDRDALKALLIADEGCVLRPYVDTVGKMTIGVGRNLTDDGISHQEAMDLLDHDIVRVSQELTAKFAWFTMLDDVRQMVLASMAFNLGMGGLMKFTQTLKAIRENHFSDAANEMMRSVWARQVGDRAQRLSNMMRSEQE